MGTLHGLTVALAAALAVPAGGAEIALPAVVRDALAAATTIPGARVVPMAFSPAPSDGCQPTHAALPRPVSGSGRVAIKLTGTGCPSWAWLRVTVLAPVAIAARPIKIGERLEGAINFVEREIVAGRAPFVVPANAVAARGLVRGQIIGPGHVRSAEGAAPGTAVKVLVRMGALAIETRGRFVACGNGRTCAVLPSGKHVEGRLDQGRLLLEGL